MRRTLTILAVIGFAIFTAATSLTEVRPGERAVIRRWGRILPDRPASGLHVGLPWGIDNVERVEVGKVRQVVVGFRDEGETEGGDPTPTGQMLTGDHNLVNAQAEIYYRVVEDQVDRYVLQSARADALVGRVAESVLAEWIAGRNVDEVLLRGKLILPTALVEETNRRLAKYELGVQVEQTSLTRLNPPNDVKADFETVAQAQTGIRERVNRAEQKADELHRAVAGELFRVKTSTAAYAQEQRLQAQAEADTFLKRLDQYRLLSKLDGDYLNVLWQDEISRLFASLRANGQLDLLDHHISGGSLNITQFPLGTRKKN